MHSIIKFLHSKSPFLDAIFKAISPSLFLRMKLAFDLHKKRIICKKPRRAAMCKGESRFTSCKSTLVLVDIRYSTVELWPALHAMWRLVSPFLFCQFTSTPWVTRYMTILICPYLEAMWSAVSPLISLDSISPPCDLKILRMFNRPFLTDWCIMFSPMSFSWLMSISARESNLSKPSILSSTIAQIMAEVTKF